MINLLQIKVAGSLITEFKDVPADGTVTLCYIRETYKGGIVLGTVNDFHYTNNSNILTINCRKIDTAQQAHDMCNLLHYITGLMQPKIVHQSPDDGC